MMKYYQEITIVDNSDLNMYFLLSKVYLKLHLILVKNKTNLIGISFPKYKKENNFLGNKIRVFARTEKEIKDLNIKEEMINLNDYFHLTSIKEVPNGILKFAKYKRIQPKNNKNKIARRKAKRENISVEKALLKLDNFQEAFTDLPYIQLKSLSSNKYFRLFIQKEESEKTNKYLFNSYGLSQNSSLPEF